MRHFKNSSNEVSIDVSFDSAVILVILSSLQFAVLCAILFVYHNWRVCQYIVETRIGVAILVFGALLTTLTTLSSYEENIVYSVYCLLLAAGLGIVTLVVGCAVLFENASPDRPLDADGYERLPVGHQHGSMGIIIWVVTIPLIVLELLFAIGAATKAPHPIYALMEFVALIQKIVQASVYHFSLQHKVPLLDMRMGCSWLLKIISLFNFAFWVDSVVTSRTDNEFVAEVFGDGFSIIKSAYNALLIDYRLLCSLLFLEHSLELTEVPLSRQAALILDPEASSVLQDHVPPVNVEISHSSGYGYIFGLVLIALQLIAGLQYLGFVAKWVNIFPIVANCAVVVLGLMLLYGNVSVIEAERKWRETESKAVDAMVCFMGAIGFIYWSLKSSFCGLWTTHYAQTSDINSFHYLIWATVKNFIYALTIIFQLTFFVKMGPHFCCDRENHSRRMNHFLVTTMMMALLAMFISFVIDEYNGEVEFLLQQMKINSIMDVFFEAAAPIHLGFSLHLFLHFFIINRTLSQFKYNWDHQLNSQNSQASSSASTYAVNCESDTERRGERQPLMPCHMVS